MSQDNQENAEAPVRKRRSGKRLFAIAALIAFCLFLGWECREELRYLIPVKLNLQLLDAYKSTESYDALVRRIQDQKPGPDGFTFVVVGDTRSNLDIARKVLAQVATEKPVFIVSNGDLVRKGLPEEYVAHHLELVKQVAPIPFIPAPGNHEDGPTKDFAAFKALYGDTRFSFDYGGCRFAGANNGDHDRISLMDLQYLEQELSKPDAEHKFVILHIPPDFLATAVKWEDGHGFTKNADALRTLMTRQKVDQVFMGHIHGYASKMVDGVRYTITGGGGANLTTQLGAEGNVHNYVAVHVSRQGIRSEVVRLVNDRWVRSDIQ